MFLDPMCLVHADSWIPKVDPQPATPFDIIQPVLQ
jgi:hypothetical protein